VDFYASDKFGNSKLFKDALSFRVSGLLQVQLDVGERYLPGQRIVVAGTVRPELGGPMQNVRATVYVDGYPFNAEVRNGRFSHDFTLQKAIMSGTHEVQVQIVDEVGNAGDAGALFTVTPVPTTLTLKVDREMAKPGEDITIAPELLDQGGQPLMLAVNTIVTDPKKVKVLDSESVTGKDVAVRLDEYAVPGAYQVLARSEGLSAQAEFRVAIREGLDIAQEGSIITVHNTGNVAFKDAVELTAAETSIRKKLSLAPDEKAVIDLSQELPEGTYAVVVNSRLADKSFSDVMVEDNRSLLKRSPITGNVIGAMGSGGFGMLFFLLLAVLIAVVVLRRRASDLELSVKDERDADEFNEYLRSKRSPPEQEARASIRADPAVRMFVDKALEEEARLQKRHAERGEDAADPPSEDSSDKHGGYFGDFPDDSSADTDEQDVRDHVRSGAFAFETPDADQGSSDAGSFNHDTEGSDDGQQREKAAAEDTSDRGFAGFFGNT